VFQKPQPDFLVIALPPFVEKIYYSSHYTILSRCFLQSSMQGFHTSIQEKMKWDSECICQWSKSKSEQQQRLKSSHARSFGSRRVKIYHICFNFLDVVICIHLIYEIFNCWYIYVWYYVYLFLEYFLKKYFYIFFIKKYLFEYWKVFIFIK